MTEEYANLLLDGQNRVPRAPGEKGVIWAGTRFLALSLALLSACSLPSEAPPPLPEAVVEFLGPTDIQMTSKGPGLSYYRLRSSETPWAVYLLRVDLSRCDLGLEVLEAPVSEGAEDGRSPVTELLAAAGDGMMGGVNGDFFTPGGSPSGTEVVGGTIRRIRGRPALAWHPREDPWIGNPGLNLDSVLVLGWDLSRTRGDGATEVIGGFPLILEDGQVVGDLQVGERPSFSAERHPRTAVGFDPRENVLWVVVVDGRQPGYSMGMTLPELADLMGALEAQEAINLDGGGSSVMVVDGAIVSRPSDAEGERPVANALGIRRDSTFCRTVF